MCLESSRSSSQQDITHKCKDVFGGWLPEVGHKVHRHDELPHQLRGRRAEEDCEGDQVDPLWESQEVMASRGKVIAQQGGESDKWGSTGS